MLICYKMQTFRIDLFIFNNSHIRPSPCFLHLQSSTKHPAILCEAWVTERMKPRASAGTVGQSPYDEWANHRLIKDRQMTTIKTNQSIHQSINPSIKQSINQSQDIQTNHRAHWQNHHPLATGDQTRLHAPRSSLHSHSSSPVSQLLSVYT